MDKKLLVITDCDFRFSGYFNIAIKLLSGLSKMGWDVKVLGLQYAGQDHDYPFSIIPVGSINNAAYAAGNMAQMWGPDILLVMMDIPIQSFFYRSLPEYHDKYVAITPLENGPLTMSWAANLMGMQSVLFISELGRDEALKAGVQRADYIQIGIDAGDWILPTQEERVRIREALGFEKDAFIILTVADNQERKNLWAALSATEHLKRMLPFEKQIRHIMVTRENPDNGYNLNDMAFSMGLGREFVMYNKGMPQKELWALYAASDVFLLTSKAEGLGMILLEAMAAGIPIVATDTGAIHELLSDGRGFLIPPIYSFNDVWGNERRDMIDVEKAALVLRDIVEKDTNCQIKAREYVETRTWDVAIQKLFDTLEKVVAEHEQVQNEKTE